MGTADAIPPPPRARFDEFELRPEDTSLLRRGHRLRLQPQPYRVLAYLVTRSPAIVSKEELGDHVWGRGVHVDLDQSLGYCVRQIRQALGDSATEPRFVETLPRQGYRFIGRVEVIPEPAPISPPPLTAALGQEHESAQATQDPQAPATMPATGARTDGRPAAPAGGFSTRALYRAVAGIAALAAVASLAVLLVRARSGAHGMEALSNVRSLAVLPIENLSGDTGEDYLADGLTDELTTMLAMDSALRVVSRTSVMQFKGTHRPLPEIARSLGVDAVVEGSIARSGTRTHVTLQLIRAADDSHLWAESYDRDANDGTLPNEAAHTITQRLGRPVPRPGPARFVAPAAHDAYLRGRYLWPTERQVESGAWFKKATEIQPDYAEAWAGLADYYGAGIAFGRLDPRTSTRLEEAAAERALALAPESAQAHEAMAAAYLIDRWDAESADREIHRALSIDPNDAWTLYLDGCVLASMNRFPEAIEALKKLMELAPYEIPSALASMYLEGRQYDKALAEIKLRMAAAPNDPSLLYLEEEAWRSKGDYRKAMEALERFYVVGGDPRSAAAVRRAYETGGARGLLRWELQRKLRDARSTYVSPIQVASYYAQLGDREHALPLLEEGYRQHSTDCLWIEDDPAYDFLHTEKRYQVLMAKLGLPKVR